MSVPYESMRRYIVARGWTPRVMLEPKNGRRVVAWENNEQGRFCQDIEQAYSVARVREIIYSKEEESE